MMSTKKLVHHFQLLRVSSQALRLLNSHTYYLSSGWDRHDEDFDSVYSSGTAFERGNCAETFDAR